MLHLTEEETDLLSQENQFLKQTIFNLRIEMEKVSHEQGTLIQNKTAEFTNAKKELEETPSYRFMKASKFNNLNRSL